MTKLRQKMSLVMVKSGCAVFEEAGKNLEGSHWAKFLSLNFFLTLITFTTLTQLRIYCTGNVARIHKHIFRVSLPSHENISQEWMSTCQPNSDNSALRFPSQVIFDRGKTTLKISQRTQGPNCIQFGPTSYFQSRDKHTTVRSEPLYSNYITLIRVTNWRWSLKQWSFQAILYIQTIVMDCWKTSSCFKIFHNILGTELFYTIFYFLIVFIDWVYSLKSSIHVWFWLISPPILSSFHSFYIAPPNT